MFEAQATGNPSPSIQWMLSTGGGSFNPVEGATSSCYSFEASSAANNDEIEAVFTNTYGSVTSSPATLTVASSIGWLSSNWSGFADIDPCAKFTSVSAEWSVPTVSCLSGSQYSSAWVGIDGFSDSSTVEQDGTESDCSGDKSSYYAWYEMYGDSAVDNGYEVELNPADYPVQPGDVIAASVQESSDAWTLSLHDSTEAWSYATTIDFDGGSQSSAEWVLERPEICSSSCAFPQLADFGSVTFANALATANSGSESPITAFSSTGIEMLNDAGTSLLDEVDDPYSLGESFDVTWRAFGP